MSDVKCFGCDCSVPSNHSLKLIKGFLCVDCFKSLLNELEVGKK
jgi:hypothetical protein